MEALKIAIEAHNDICPAKDVILFIEPEPTAGYIKICGPKSIVSHSLIVYGNYTVQVWAVNRSDNYGFYLYDDVEVKSTDECIKTILKALDDLLPEAVEQARNAMLA